MNAIPSFEEILLQIHQSLGLSLESSKDKNKLSAHQKKLNDHLKQVNIIIDDICNELGFDSFAIKDAQQYLGAFITFYNNLEKCVWTLDADKRQIHWLMAAFVYMPGLGRLVANWSLEGRLDKDVPAGDFWYLPKITTERNGIEELVLPVPQVLEWVMDLMGKSIPELAESLEDKEKCDADSIERTLFNWKAGKIPRVDSIHSYFSEEKDLSFDGTLTFEQHTNTEQQYETALGFMGRKNLDINQIKQQIPKVSTGRIEAILDGSASEEEKAHFIKLLKDRYAPPSVRTIRQRLLIARATQDGYLRLGKALLGSNFDETCANPSSNKVLQLFAIFGATYNPTVEAYNKCEDEAGENKYFEEKVVQCGLKMQLMSILPSMRETSASELGSMLTKMFRSFSPHNELEDLIGFDEQSHIVIRERNLALRNIEIGERTKYFETRMKLKNGLIPDEAFQSVTSFEVINRLALDSNLGLEERRAVLERMTELVQAPHEKIQTILFELSLLLNNEERKLRTKNAKDRVEVLLSKAKRSSVYSSWEPVFLQYEAKHHLAFNDFEGALKLFKNSLKGLKLSCFVELRGEVARDAFSLVVTHTPRGFCLHNYEHYFRDMLFYGALSSEGKYGEIPSFEDVACDMAEYFNDTLYLPYHGEINESGFAARDGTNLLDEIFSLRGNKNRLLKWVGKNKDLRAKRLREVRGDSALMLLMKVSNSDAIKHISKLSDKKSLRMAILMIIEKWPKLVNLTDFKKQSPLLLAAGEDDFEILRKLLKKGADTSQAEFNGRTALHSAVSIRSLQCVGELLNYMSSEEVRRLKDRGESSVLHTAVKVGGTEVAQLLIQHTPKLKECKDANGETPLELVKRIISDSRISSLLAAELNRNGREIVHLNTYHEIASLLSPEVYTIH